MTRMDYLLCKFGSVVESIAIKKLEIKRLKREAEAIRKTILSALDNPLPTEGDMNVTQPRVDLEASPSAPEICLTREREQWSAFMTARIESRRDGVKP